MTTRNDAAVIQIPEQGAAVRSARAGGVALVAASALFMAVFALLAATFDYPGILDRPAAEVLPRLTALGWAGRATWAVYALVPLLLLPAGTGVVAALGRDAPTAARLARMFARLAAACMTLGLSRWPTILWELGGSWAAGSAAERAAIVPLFDGLNTVLGTAIGELAGELFLSSFFAATAVAMLRSTLFPRWVGGAGLVASAFGLVAMLRNLTDAVAVVASLNNLVLPLWLIVLGVVLARGPRPRRS